MHGFRCCQKHSTEWELLASACIRSMAGFVVVVVVIKVLGLRSETWNRIASRYLGLTTCLRLASTDLRLEVRLDGADDLRLEVCSDAQAVKHRHVISFGIR